MPTIEPQLCRLLGLPHVAVSSGLRQQIRVIARWTTPPSSITTICRAAMMVERR